jgi:Trk K+ transport system NAD-binding subunit
MTDAYGSWRGHVIVCGLHGVGLRIVEELSLSGVPAVVVDDQPDPGLAGIMSGWGVPRLDASPRAADALTAAGLAGAIAVVSTQDNDLHTLETALLVRKLRGDVRIVVELANPAVGRALTQISVAVLDVAGLSAPSIAEACLGSGAQELVLSGERFAIARTAAPRPGTLRELYGALAPVAVTKGTDVDVGRPISLLYAAYFTVETVTTVGYGDFSFRNQSPLLVAAAICLMLAGALFVAVFFALLTNVLVSRRIEESLGRRRITGLSGHVLVIGLGSVGMQVVLRLVAHGRPVVVVEKDEHNRRLGQARALGVPVVIADATLPQALESVSLRTASAVAVLTSDDLANLESGLTVRDQLGERFAHVPVVLRMFDAQLARSVKEGFGFALCRSTAALAAPWFVGAALGLDVLSTFYAGDEPLLVARLTITPGGGLTGLAMGQLSARIRVLAIRRAADRSRLDHPPRRGTRFQPADEAYLIGPYEQLLAVLRRDRPSPQAEPAHQDGRIGAPPSGKGGNAS